MCACNSKGRSVDTSRSRSRNTAWGALAASASSTHSPYRPTLPLGATRDLARTGRCERRPLKAGLPHYRPDGRTMELRHLRYFVAVARNSISAAPPSACTSHSLQVSEQVRKLEDELGRSRLLDRSQRSVSLTDAGAAFLTEARHVAAGCRGGTVGRPERVPGALHRLRIGICPPHCRSACRERYSG